MYENNVIASGQQRWFLASIWPMKPPPHPPLHKNHLRQCIQAESSNRHSTIRGALSFSNQKLGFQTRGLDLQTRGTRPAGDPDPHGVPAPQRRAYLPAVILSRPGQDGM